MSLHTQAIHPHETSNPIWRDICQMSDLVENSGVCALLPSLISTPQSSREVQISDQHAQIAIFYLPKTQSVYALSNWDPIGKANVMYRGIVGSIADEAMVSSPLYKQHFSLLSGKCFEDESVALKTYSCRLFDGKVQICNQYLVSA
ncbi:nitrite reductase small subunit NirD [Ningiella sp. W23]|uniref:nitrite reductase small subunit NirD n=1 Tax=Ningiella sp. W23 TaxID=3023715 RepID=UPI003757A495